MLPVSVAMSLHFLWGRLRAYNSKMRMVFPFILGGKEHFPAVVLADVALKAGRCFAGHGGVPHPKHSSGAAGCGPRWLARALTHLPTFSTRFLLLGWCILLPLSVSASLPAASCLQDRLGPGLSPGSHAGVPRCCPGRKWAGRARLVLAALPG